MKKIYPYLACAIAIQLFAISSFAQTVDENSVLKISPLNITVDGNLKDWGDSLQYLNAESNTRYALSNDKENLYFAIKIEDRSEAIRVLKAGLTLGIDPKGKKKSAYSITFPLNTQTDALQPRLNRDDMGEVTQADRDELVRETITTLRGIKVAGFKDIEGDMITTSNTYGIKATITYDDKGNLICEASVALKLFHLDGPNKAEWIYDVKINGIARPAETTAATTDGGGRGMGGGGRGGRGGGGGMGGGGGRGGMGGGGGRGGRSGGGGAQGAGGYNSSGGSSLSKSVDFSGKFYLAQAQ